MIATLFTSKLCNIGNAKTMLLGLFIYITANLEIVFGTLILVRTIL